jgi:hypothetical protein
VVKGGSGNYRYQWEAGSTQCERKELPEGDYTFTVTDDNDCRLTENYHLPYIRTLQPLLRDDIIVCKDNTAFLNPGHFSAYNWFLDGESLAQDSILEVDQPGDYVVIVNDEDHCVGSDTVKVDVSVSDLEPSFLMATSVPMNDTLLVVEVTQPKPSGIMWDIEGSHKVVEEGEYFTKVVFEEQGLFSVMLSAYLIEGCQGQARKSVLVTAPVNGEEDTETVFYGNNLISLVVSPNPSSGQFNAQLELREPADVTFYLVCIDTGQIYETRKRSGLSDYNEKFVHAGVGQFVLFAESGGERLMVKLLVY